MTKALLKANKIKVTILDPKTGQKVDQYQLSADGDVSTVQDIAHVDSKGRSPCSLVGPTQVYEDHQDPSFGNQGHCRHSKSRPSWSDSIESFEVFSPNDLAADPHFLVQYQATEGHWADVFHVKPDKKGATVEKSLTQRRQAGRPWLSLRWRFRRKGLLFTRVAKGAFAES